jgi:hypothetical protein
MAKCVQHFRAPITESKEPLVHKEDFIALLQQMKDVRESLEGYWHL